MSSSFHTVALDALNLDESDRLRLAAELIDSVEGPADPGWERAWSEEINRRTAAADAREACGNRVALNGPKCGPGLHNSPDHAREGVQVGRLELEHRDGAPEGPRGSRKLQRPLRGPVDMPSCPVV